MDKRREFSKSQLELLGARANLHVLIEGKVYDLREFVSEHPGGDLVLLGEGGKDGTKAWRDIEHSDEAKELMQDYLVGYCSDVSPKPLDDEPLAIKSPRLKNTKIRLLPLLVPIGIAVALGIYWTR